MITKGQKINDRYEIIRSIGEGGMANVYLGYDTILDRNVAIKILRGDLSSDEKFVRRFQREALSASSLAHPNIVEMYDVGEDDGVYYIVMEYVEGKTLKQLLKKHQTKRKMFVSYIIVPIMLLTVISGLLSFLYFTKSQSLLRFAGKKCLTRLTVTDRITIKLK